MDKKRVIIADEFRTNTLSLVPGGSEIEVHYRDRVKVYTKIKNPKAYINAITKDDAGIIAIFVDGKQWIVFQG